MRLIDIKTLRTFWARYPDAESPLRHWASVAEEAQWRNIQEVRRVFATADAVRVAGDKTATVFNIGGGKYRLITAIHYGTQIAFLMMVLTHKEYDTNKWKEQL